MPIAFMQEYVDRKDDSMRRKNIAVCILCVLLLVFALAGCNAEDDTPAVTEGTPQTEGQVQTEGTEQTEVAGATEAADVFTEPVNPEVVVVSTEFGDLYYQEQWSEFMRTEQTSDGASVVVTFEAEINGVRYPLFEVTIGEGEGDPVGQITDDAGTKRNVYIRVEEVAESSELTSGEQNRLYAMQEEINYVIENLK